MILINILLVLYLINQRFCLFDEQLKMDKPSHKSALFFRRKNQNEFIISNSKTSILYNIRTGEKEEFPAIIPSNCTIYEPYFGYYQNEDNAFLVDAQTKDNFIKIYLLKNNEYHEYKNININKIYKRKYETYNNRVYYDRFVVGIQDNDNNFQLILIDFHGNEIFKSQKINVGNCNDFILHSYTSSEKRTLINFFFYDDKIVLHQWTGVENSNLVYYTQTINSNKNIKQNNIQYLDPDKSLFCGQNDGDIYCHQIWAGYLSPIHVAVLYNKILQGCKSIYKLNTFNNERKIISCINNKNEFVIQLFSYEFVLDYDLNGLVLWKDGINEDFSYDVLQGKENEIVVLRANLKTNEYFIEMFNFIKNSNNKYQLCPEGCQNCYFKNSIGIQYPNNSLFYVQNLNCSLCNANKYFAENHQDKCFKKEERIDGYEFRKR